MTPPVFAHGSLRLYLLALLEERPRHGYELIQALSERFGGTYSPSAGTIYPRLAKLEEEGLVTKVADGRKTVYEITDAGRAELDARRRELDAIEDEVTDSVRRLADGVRAEVNDAMRTLRAELASAAAEAKRAAKAGFAAAGGAATSAAGAAADAASAASDASTGTPADGRADGPDDGSTTFATGATGATGSTTFVGGTVNHDAGAHRAVQEIDLVLSEFRRELRTDLRARSRRDKVSAATVESVRSRLAEVRAAVLADLDR